MENSAAHRPHIIERKVKVNGTVREYACELVYRDSGMAVVAYRIEQGGFRTPVTIPAGSVSYGWFWRARPYGLYRFRGPDGEVLAHRFDALTGLVLGDDVITYRDLVLDWWILPGDVLLEEDRDEYDALLAAGALRRSDIAKAEQAAREITSRYRHIIDGVEAVEARVLSE